MDHNIQQLIWFWTPLVIGTAALLWVISQAIKGNFEERSEKLERTLNMIAVIYQSMFFIGVMAAYFIPGPR